MPPPKVAVFPFGAIETESSLCNQISMPFSISPRLLIAPWAPVIAKKGILFALAYFTSDYNQPREDTNALSLRLTVSVTSFSVATSTTIVAFGASKLDHRLVAIKNAADVG